jgi:hypothetical protein
VILSKPVVLELYRTRVDLRAEVFLFRGRLESLEEGIDGDAVCEVLIEVQGSKARKIRLTHIDRLNVLCCALGLIRQESRRFAGCLDGHGRTYDPDKVFMAGFE